jgi:cation transport regulator ChaC
MQKENVKLSVEELENRVKTAQSKFEFLRLREEITTFIKSPQFKELSQRDKNRVEDLLVKVIAKEEQYKGCDPWKVILNH